VAEANRTIVVGGGLAGLAATAALAEHGRTVTLLESRPRLGGRASSFTDRATDAPIDNCQHVSMGCCTNFDHFCRTVGIDHLLHTEEELWFIGPDGSRSRFAAASLPAPFHLFPALLNLKYLTSREKRQLIRGLRALVRMKNADQHQQSIGDWLIARGQSPEVIERFWLVVLVSALSESLDRISLSAARKVFADGFIANRLGWQVKIPTVPLGELYGNRLAGWYAQQGVTIKLQTGVESILLRDQRAVGVRLRDGSELEAEDVVLAIPQDRVANLIPDDAECPAEIERANQLETAPISSVHLWFDRPVMDLPHAVLVERLSQWIFDRGQTPTPHGNEMWQYYQVVISASRELAGRSQEEVIADVTAEIAEIWPETRQAELKHSRLVTEHKAVISMTPGSDALRPGPKCGIAHLHLAGDWTDTGWPSTMEGAVRSGYAAAENVLSEGGAAEKPGLVQADLPASLLSKLLFGL